MSSLATTRCFSRYYSPSLISRYWQVASGGKWGGKWLKPTSGERLANSLVSVKLAF